MNKEDLEQLQKYDLYEIEGPEWEYAKGSYFVDSENNKWLDMTSGILSAGAGHNNKKIIRSIMNPLKAGIAQSWYRPSKYRLEAHKALQKVLPEGFTKTIFLVTGSEAVEQALKIARHLRPDKNVISMTYNYHGSTLAAESMNMIREEGLQITSPICTKGYCPYGKNQYESCGKECFEKSISKLKNPGAIITSPYVGAYSSWMPKEYYQTFIDWIKENNILWIDDEVQSGFYRTGSFCFGEQSNSFLEKKYGRDGYYLSVSNYYPDIILAGKGATSLLPLSFLSINDRIRVPVNDYFSTHSGNPVCLAALKAAIDFYLENKIGERVEELGYYLSNELDEIKDDYYSHIVGRFGYGFAQSLLFNNDEDGKELVSRIIIELRKKHVLFMDTNRPILKFLPPLVTTKKQLSDTIKIVREVLQKYAN